MSSVKRCLAGCLQLLPVTEFGPAKGTWDGLNARCRACIQRIRHGLTREDKTTMAHAQDGCAICGRDDPGGKGWVVDHDHSCCSGERSCTACRRGVLCFWCNAALGYAIDNPTSLRRMADFLELGTRIAPATPVSDSASDIQRTNEHHVRSE